MASLFKMYWFGHEYFPYFAYKNAPEHNEQVKTWTAKRDPWRNKLKAGDRIDVLVKCVIADDNFGKH